MDALKEARYQNFERTVRKAILAIGNAFEKTPDAVKPYDTNGSVRYPKSSLVSNSLSSLIQDNTGLTRFNLKNGNFFIHIEIEHGKSVQVDDIEFTSAGVQGRDFKVYPMHGDAGEALAMVILEESIKFAKSSNPRYVQAVLADLQKTMNEMVPAQIQERVRKGLR